MAISFARAPRIPRNGSRRQGDGHVCRKAVIALSGRVRGGDVGLARGRFEKESTLEGLDFQASPKPPAAQIRDLPALRWLHAGESMILYGPAGIEKATSRSPRATPAIRHGADARFLKTSRALARLGGGHADHTWHKRLGELARPAVLILDYFAMRELTPPRPATSMTSNGKRLGTLLWNQEDLEATADGGRHGKKTSAT
jgi:hypothetical protein